jgi:hypothetical protein
METVTGAFSSSFFLLPEDRARLQVREIRYHHAEGVKAHFMVEQHDSERQFIKVDLVSEQFDLRVGEKVIACQPPLAANRAFFECVPGIVC